jgi:hypothetical protein
MKLAAVDALTDVEHSLSDALADALSEAECARLEFEGRLATAFEQFLIGGFCLAVVLLLIAAVLGWML